MTVKRQNPDAKSAKGRIVSAARQLFSENGYTKTTTSAIAKAAKVNETTIFRIFKNKKELFHEIYYSLTPGPENLSLAELSNGEDLENDLRVLFKDYTILHILHMPEYRLSIQLMDELYDRTLYMRSFRRIEDMISQLVSYFNFLKYSGKIADMDYTALVEYLFSLFLVRATEFLLPGQSALEYDDAMVDAFSAEYASFIYKLIKK